MGGKCLRSPDDFSRAHALCGAACEKAEILYATTSSPDSKERVVAFSSMTKLLEWAQGLDTNASDLFATMLGALEREFIHHTPEHN